MNLNWKNWCRFCGSAGITTKMEITSDLEYHFQICDKSAKICNFCCTYISEFQTFVEKSKTVTQLFQELSKSDENIDIQKLNQTRIQFDLDILINEESCPSKNDVPSEIKVEPVFEDFLDFSCYMESENESSKSLDSFALPIKAAAPKPRKRNKKPRKEIEIDPNADTSAVLQKNCHLCQIKFVSWKKMAEHCKNDHECQPHVPCVCGAILKTYGIYKYHLKRCRVNPYQCDLCPNNFMLKKKLEVHMNIRHKSDSVRYICKSCEKECWTQKQLEDHERSHLPDHLRLIVPCPNCEMRFATKAKVTAHIRRVHTHKSFLCQTCGSAFKTTSGLNKHLTIHSTSLDHQCDICEKKFKSYSDLYGHRRNHFSKNEKCPICFETFKYKGKLTQHMISHSEERRFQCPQCPNKYKRNKDLKNHLRQHSGARPYSCEFCDQTFIDGSNCRKHKKKHHPIELEAWELAHGKGDRGRKLQLVTEPV